MKKAYRMFKRNNVYYIQNNGTKEQKSLGTKDKCEAEKLLFAYNDNRNTCDLNLGLGLVYIERADPKRASRTWQEAMNEYLAGCSEISKARCQREFDSQIYHLIRSKPIVQTIAEDLQIILKRGGSATNNYLRRLHNLALDNGWMSWHLITPKKWPRPEKKPKRGITQDEHCKIIAAEQNEERRNYYEMLWLIGSAQTDCSLLTHKNVDWERRVLFYYRKKTGELSSIRIGESLESLLKNLPKEGFLFPKMASLRDTDRSAEFSRRCKLLGIQGISLHSYRYAWAERAYESGYEERYAKAALGHKSSAIHHGYAKKAQVICPPLENLPRNVIELNSTEKGEDNEKAKLA